MTKVYVVIIKATQQFFFYTTLAAIGAAHSKQEINLKPESLKHIKFVNDVYENRLVIIRRGILRTKREVENDKKVNQKC